MGRIYTVSFQDLTVVGGASETDTDVISLTPATNKPILVHGLFLGPSSDVSDVVEELLRYRAIRGYTTIGTGGSAKTPIPMAVGDAAAGFTARVNDKTTIASSGSPVDLHSGVFASGAGEQPGWLEPEARWGSAGTALLVIRIAAPAVSRRMSGTIYVEEQG